LVFSILLGVAVVNAAPAADPCNGSSTPEVNACISSQLDRSNARLDKYIRAALNRYAGDDEAAVRLGIQSSQAAFEAYRSIECDTVYEDWKDGTIRRAMSLACRTSLTDQRTHDVWQHWLRYMDSTPPILAEPKPTE
jgi:uncharacterized protein YecT (DUF1311 family)